MKGEQGYIMQNIYDQARSRLPQRKGMVVFLSLVLILALIFWCPTLWAAPEKEKPAKKPVPAPGANTTTGSSIKSSAINDSNINAALKRADEMMKKGEVDGPLKILVSVYEYSKDVLSTVKFFQGHYEKAVNDPTTA